MSVGIREWLDENSKSEYPLSKSLGVNGVIVSANFTQFDGFVPILKSIKIGDASMDITIKFDVVETTVSLTKNEYFHGISKAYYDGTRRLGIVTFGDGVLTLFNDRTNTTLTPNIEFEPSTVCDISLAAGVYRIQGSLKGSVEIDTGEVPHIFFGVTGNEVIWNAVGLATPLDFTPLKTFNNVAPQDNNIKLQDTTLVKVTPSFSGLTISLANSEINDKIAPVRKYA
jgi:hypothetical protein